MSSLTKLSRKFGKILVDNSPKILTGLGVAGVVSTTVLAVRSTLLAVQRIEDEATDNYGGYPNRIPTKEKLKLIWPYYVPPAAVGIVTIACIITGNSVSSKRNAALVSLYTLTENGFREYQDKVVATYGEKDEQKLRDDIAQDRVNANPISSREVIILPGSNNVLFYDDMSGRYFESTVELVRRAENDLNQKVLHTNYASQNDWYSLLDLPRTGYGDEVGWNTDTMLVVDFSTTLSEDNRPCIAIKYRVYPIRGYYTISE